MRLFTSMHFSVRKSVEVTQDNMARWLNEKIGKKLKKKLMTKMSEQNGKACGKRRLFLILRIYKKSLVYSHH